MAKISGPLESLGVLNLDPFSAVARGGFECLGQRAALAAGTETHEGWGKSMGKVPGNPGTSWMF